ncbi:MAG: MFS transporter [Anaerolineales bacterium]|nr:MFS transporter [Anaerolineales bacterium]
MNQIGGMRGFVVLWLGQLVSLLGTAMSRFALTIWAYETTGSVTALALVGFFSFGPTVLLSPIAGALVDRWDRKKIMIATDLVAGLMSTTILLLLYTDNLELWHLYVAGAITGAFESFQFPAFSAAITMMVPKEQYARASGMQSLADAATQIAAPLLAGILLVVIKIEGVLLIDVVTFLVAVGSLLFILVPRPAGSQEGQAVHGSLWQESLFGFRYIWNRPSLLGMQLVFFGINFTFIFSVVLLPPLILSLVENGEVILGTVQSATGFGALVGALLLTAWGGPARKVHGVLLGMILGGLLGQTMLGLGTGVLWWSVCGFFMMFFSPLLNGSNQAIWQAKVPPDLQGRVFSVRRLIAQITGPVAMLLAGPLADRLFEPAMMPGGLLADSFGFIVGTGPGAGIRLIFVLTGLLSVLIGMAGYAFPAIREIEERLPDHTPEATAV